jgi:hypothetical protein
MSTPRNQHNTPLLGVVTIGLIRQEADKFVNLDTHYFYRDTDESNGLWVWFHRHADETSLSRVEQAEALPEILNLFLERTSLGDQIAITLETSDDEGDGPTSLCAGDVLRIIGSACLDTRIELIAIDGESFGGPRLVRWGPIPDTPAVFIATFAAEDLDGPITTLFSNVAMTEWHEDLNQWHLWEVLYKSGDNYILFQSEIGHDDQVFTVNGADGIPAELLVAIRSVTFPADGVDLHPIDKWGRLLIEDIARQYLPH